MADRPACRCRRNGVYLAPPESCPDPRHSGDVDAYETPYELARAEGDELIIRRMMSELPLGMTAYGKRRTSE